MRSKKKGYFIRNFNRNSKTNRTWARNCIISNSLINRNIGVHNGKQLINLKINRHMVGHKLGEFAFTRKIYQYKKGKKK